MIEAVGKFHQNPSRDKKANWDYTEFHAKITKKKGFHEEKSIHNFREKSKFLGRPFIGRDSKIDGGVYVGGAKESIVVDGEKYQELDDVYQTLLKWIKISIKNGFHYKDGLLHAVWQLTKKIIPYDKNAVSYIESKTAQYQKVGLQVFFGGGVCRHQALLAAYLLERLGKDGIVNGYVSIDRNWVKASDGRNMGGHAWARYTNSGGEIFILDAAQDYIGPLKEMNDMDQDRWFYERPEDVSKIEKVKANVRRKAMRMFYKQ